jgi:hypothetical protein
MAERWATVDCSIWINRFGETAEPAPTRELPTLTGLGDTLDELVPPG